MNIVDILDPTRVTASLSVNSKKRALEELSQMLGSSPGVDAQEAFTSLINREKLGSTGLGQGVAIPHGRLRQLDTTVAAFARLEAPVDYDANDGQPTDLLFAMLVPQEATDDHLQLLAKIAELFSDDGFVDAVRKANGAADIFELLTSYQAAESLDI